MSKGRVLRSQIATANSAKGRVLRSEISTAVVPHAKGRVLRSEIETAPAARGRVLRSEIETSIAFTANAGIDQSVKSLDRVYLTAAASTGDPPPNGWQWDQVAGPPVTFHPSATVEQVSFIAPATVEGTTVSVVVTTSNGVDDPVESDPVNIEVEAHHHWYGRAGQTVPALHFLSGH